MTLTDTPDQINELEPGDCFVFGSNAEGQHWGGAAAHAHRNFGAEWGVGEGPTGRCYALPTMTGLADIQAAIERFIEHAKATPEVRYLVTRIGCGIAGHAPADIAPAFTGHPANIIIPADFQAVIQGATS